MYNLIRCQFRDIACGSSYHVVKVPGCHIIVHLLREDIQKLHIFEPGDEELPGWIRKFIVKRYEYF